MSNDKDGGGGGGGDGLLLCSFYTSTSEGCSIPPCPCAEVGEARWSHVSRSHLSATENLLC